MIGMRPLKKIILEVIPHAKQRYETAGDYYRDVEGNMRIYVSKLPDNRFELLIMIHELVEAILTEYNGIPESAIAKFDIEFEKKRAPENIDEPGDDLLSPYAAEHSIATSVERLMSGLLNVNWKQYSDEVNKLSLSEDDLHHDDA